MNSFHSEELKLTLVKVNPSYITIWIFPNANANQTNAIVFTAISRIQSNCKN